MPIEFVCPACRRTLRVPEASAGRAVRCGGCMTVVRVPEAGAAPPADVPPANPEPQAAQRPAGEDLPRPVRAEPVAPAGAPEPGERDTAEPRPSRGPEELPDRDRPRTRRRRPPPKPAGRGVLFWLVIIFLTLGLLIACGCGGLLWVGFRVDWNTHRSERGGFQVDLPAAPRDDMAEWGQIRNLPAGAGVEGTILFLRLEEYVVVYSDLDRRGVDEQKLLDEAVNSLAAGPPPGRVVRNERTTVSGFPARDVAVEIPGEGVALGRVVIAGSRVYVVLAGGDNVTAAGNERTRRFLDSFEVTDPKLLAARDQREEARRREAARQAADREWQEKERARLEQLRREAEEKQRLADEAFENGPYAGPAAPDPAALTGLVLYLPFDDPDPSADRVSGRPVVKLVGGAKPCPGPRGRGVVAIAKGATVDASAGVSALRFNRDTPFTVAGWYRQRSGGYLLAASAPPPPVPPGVPPTLDTRLQLLVGWGNVIADVRSTEVHNKIRTWYLQTATADAGKAGVADDRWHHFAIVRRRTPAGETVELYLDGRAVGKRELQGVATDLTALAELRFCGPFRPGADLHVECQGAVDEFCAFNRALGEKEVAYLAGREPAVPPPAADQWRALPADAVVRLKPGPNLGPVAAVAFDPQRKKVWAVAVPAGEPAADGKPAPFRLDRYSYPDFQKEASYRLPGRAYHAALDVPGHRLFLAMDEQPDRDRNPAARPSYPATLHRYDLAALPGPDPEDPPEVKPAAQTKVTGHVAGLAVADGRVFALVDIPPKKVRLLARYDGGLADKPVPVPSARLAGGPRLSVSEDGKRVWFVVANQFDRALFTARTAENFQGFHGEWQLDDPPEDWADSPDRRVYACRADGRVWVTDVSGDPNGPRVVREVQSDSGRFLGLAPRDSLLFVAGLEQVWAFRTDTNRDRPKDWPAAAELVGTEEHPVGGLFWVGPDGRSLVFTSGQVVRVEVEGPKPPG